MPKLSLRILMTEECDLRCIFCHNEGQRRQTQTLQLSVATIRNILQALVLRGLRRAKFSGGEPTLNPLLPSYVATAFECGISDVSVITHGQNEAVAVALARAHPRLRFSINIPAANAEEYRRMTGGVLIKTLQTVDSLRNSGNQVAFNIYCSTPVNLLKLKALIGLARTHEASLKLLTPCQLSTPDRQTRHAELLKESLAKLGYKFEERGDYYSRYSGDAESIKVVEPWCPVNCGRLNATYVTLRLTARGELQPCFRSEAYNLPIEPLDFSNVATTVDKAIALSGAGCSQDNSRVRIIRRMSIGEADLSGVNTP